MGRKHRGICFYPYHAPNGATENIGAVFSTHIWSLRDSGKHWGPFVSYPDRVPNGATENIGAGVSTHIWSLQDSGKHWGPFVSYPDRVPNGATENIGAGVSTHIMPLTGLRKTVTNHQKWFFVNFGDS